LLRRKLDVVRETSELVNKTGPSDMR